MLLNGGHFCTFSWPWTIFTCYLNSACIQKSSISHHKTKLLILNPTSFHQKVPVLILDLFAELPRPQAPRRHSRRARRARHRRSPRGRGPEPRHPRRQPQPRTRRAQPLPRRRAQHEAGAPQCSAYGECPRLANKLRALLSLTRVLYQRR